MQQVKHLPGRTARIDGDEWLYFSGTAYLGIVQNEAFQGLVQEGISRYGTHYGGSRLASVQIGIFEEAEVALARRTGAPAALIVSSGMLAGQLALRAFGRADTNYYCAPGLHPALWPENYQPSTGTFQEWSRNILQQLQTTPKTATANALLLANALDATYAKTYHFDWLRDMKTAVSTLLIADDSHGLGITGENGGGIYACLPEGKNLGKVVVSSLAKAYGIPGGVILGTQENIQRIRQHPFFGGASPASPAFLYALCRGEALYREARSRLRRNINRFHQLTKHTALFESVEDHPVFYTPENGLAAFLAGHKILISSFPYPTPSDAAVTRIVLNALHTTEDIDRLGTLVQAFAKEAHLK